MGPIVMTNRLNYISMLAMIIITMITPAKLSAQMLSGNLILTGPAVAQVFDSDNVFYNWVELRHYFPGRSSGLLACAETAGDGSYFALGIYKDIRLFSNLYGVICFSPGLVMGEGEDQLGHIIEFRTAIELNCQFPKNIRLGIGIAHYSNSSMGDINPGTESIRLLWYLPLSKS